MDDIHDLGGIKLTDRQIQRQVKKLKELLFENYEEYEDGTYKGEVITEISDIISKYIGPEEEISQIKLLECISRSLSTVLIIGLI